jgi:hypothetical protein
MARAVPSQVRQLILRLFPDIEAEPNTPGQRPLRVGTTVRAAVDLLGRIPDELIRLSASDFADYYGNVSALRGAWDDRNPSTNQLQDRELIPHSGHTSLFEIQRLLGKCPDEAPAAGTTGLEFLDDYDFRQALRTDISSANSSLMNHEYKAATVIGGSVAEALLLWALEKRGDPNVIGKTSSKPLNEWMLGDLILAARACDLITDQTKQQAELAQRFRNLIHPGRQRRLQEKCDRGTAFGALAAVERVAMDLEKKFPPANP